MPQLDNDKILGRILRSTIGVISRRTSETYANVVIGNAVDELAEKYSFLNYVEMQGSKYTEIFNVVDIKPEINNIPRTLLYWNLAWTGSYSSSSFSVNA